jgi:phosphoglycerol transferase MdoB-like AlkP superfamily enzyme
MNKQAVTGKPFNHWWLLVTTDLLHPNDKIDIPGDTKSRDGGVKYTDYALKKFFTMAKKQSWFKNTVFVIADHCASSVKKQIYWTNTEYLLWFIVLAILHRSISNLSQIDIMPTVFGLLRTSLNFFVKMYWGKAINQEPNCYFLPRPRYD